MSNVTNRNLRYELLQQAVGIECYVLSEEQIHSVVSTQAIRLVAQFREDQVENSAFGILFTLAEVSFRESRPLETSDPLYQEKDEWTIRDFLQHLSFVDSKLEFYSKIARGRVVNTNITLSSDGIMEIHTYSRGRSASRWVASLHRKTTILSSRQNLFIVENIGSHAADT